MPYTGINLFYILKYFININKNVEKLRRSYYIIHYVGKQNDVYII